MVEYLTVPPDEVREELDARLVPEPPPTVRTEAQRDRDRILYSSAFLRLGHVTQVASPEAGHIFHSRLTHSLKVAQVARGLAQRFKVLADRGELEPNATRLVACLDEDATEAAALAHDLGHPPFGHLAEKALQAEAEHADFEGNAQSFRIVTRLAVRSVIRHSENASIGLNLSRRTLNGILKYPWLRAEDPPGRWDKWGAYRDGDRKAFEWARTGCPDGKRTLEACLMDWADDVTYAVHDMDDFYRAGLVPLERLSVRGSAELERFKDHLRERTPRLLEGEEGSDPERLVEVADRLFVEGVFSSVNMPFRGRTDERVNLRQLGSKLIGLYVEAPQLRDTPDGKAVELAIDSHLVDQVRVLKQLTWFYVINRPSLSIIQRGQTQIVKTLFEMYRSALAADELHLFPPLFAERIRATKGAAGRERAIVDLIAGMSEESAAEIYRQRVGITSGSLLAQVAGPA